MKYLCNTAMKKISLIALLVIYSLASFGIGIKQFYCCGVLKSTTVHFIGEKEQQCAKEDKEDGCCKTKYQVFQVKDNHISAGDINTSLKYATDLHLDAPVFELVFIDPQLSRKGYTSHAPPLHHGIPLYILHCVYRI